MYEAEQCDGGEHWRGKETKERRAQKFWSYIFWKFKIGFDSMG